MAKEKCIKGAPSFQKLLLHITVSVHEVDLLVNGKL